MIIPKPRCHKGCPAMTDPISMKSRNVANLRQGAIVSQEYVHIKNELGERRG